MKKLILFILAIVALIVVGVIAITNKSNPLPSTNNNSTRTSSSNQNPSTGSITAINMMFTPSQITVAKGGTVTWTNKDKVTHTVVDDLSNVGGPESGIISPGETYSFTFNKTGSFQYHDRLHTSMRGTIVVK